MLPRPARIVRTEPLASPAPPRARDLPRYDLHGTAEKILWCEEMSCFGYLGFLAMFRAPRVHNQPVPRKKARKTGGHKPGQENGRAVEAATPTASPRRNERQGGPTNPSERFAEADNLNPGNVRPATRCRQASVSHSDGSQTWKSRQLVLGLRGGE